MLAIASSNVTVTSNSTLSWCSLCHEIRHSAGQRQVADENTANKLELQYNRCYFWFVAVFNAPHVSFVLSQDLCPLCRWGQ